MWRLALILMVIAVSLAYGFEKPATSDADQAAIKAVLDSYITSIQKEDMELYAKNISHDTTMVNFGAFGPPIVGWAVLKGVIAGQNESLSQTKITQSDVAIHVSPSGQWAWATSLWDLSATMGDAPVQLAVRCTWVLEKQDGRWVIVHFHKSVAAG